MTVNILEPLWYTISKLTHMNKKQYLIDIIFVFFILLLAGCNNSASKENALKEIRRELASLKSSLPFKVPSTDIWLTTLELEDSLLICTVEMSKEDWDIYSMPEKEANSDRNVARIIRTFDQQMSHLLEKNNLGFKYVYADKETKQTWMSISVDPQRLKDIKTKLDNGEISPYSILELFEMEITRYDIPCMMEDGVWLTDAYINGNCVYYEATIEEELDPSAFDYNVLTEMKKEIIADLKNTPLLLMSKNEMIKEHINIVYMFKDNNGIEVAKIRITPTDIFQN